MNITKIEWTHRPNTIGCTWNPIHFKRDDGGSDKTGNMCTRISPGCTHCYASTLNQRWGNRLEFIAQNLSKGHFYLDEKEWQAPLRTKKPCTIFVGDMFDLFHEAIPDEMIASVFRMMCETAHRHVFQVLTKRADRMRDFFCAWDSRTRDFGPLWPYTWPRATIWLGVSCENQKYADERIPLLLQTPAAVRFLSVEPQLEAVDLVSTFWRKLSLDEIPGYLLNAGVTEGAQRHRHGVDWVIVGGESGPKARPFNLAWAESLREQCKAAGVAFFMKQVGSRPRVPCDDPEHAGSATPARGVPHLGCHPLVTKDRKGGDPSEWPESLRVREWPA